MMERQFIYAISFSSFCAIEHMLFYFIFDYIYSTFHFDMPCCYICCCHLPLGLFDCFLSLNLSGDALLLKRGKMSYTVCGLEEHCIGGASA